MEWGTTIDWASWLQAVASIAAVFATPPALTFAGRWLLYRIEFGCEPIGSESLGASQRWRLTIKNRSQFARGIRATVYPPEPGNGVIFAAVRSENDGGVQVSDALVDDHVLIVNIIRLAPHRVVVIDLIFRKPDKPEFETEGAKGQRVFQYGRDPAARRALMLLESHTRLVMLMLQFMAATLILIGRLVVIAVED